MTMQTDVKNVHRNSSGLLVEGRTRVKGMVLTSTSAGVGTILVKDGGSSGTTMIEIDVPATSAFHSVTIPGEGVLFKANAYAALTNCSVSVFYG